jgi:EAL domain-containing protein (putative c-di-GMP-specific phosphodiesterase class I)/GGDEF domain-containing protein
VEARHRLGKEPRAEESPRPRRLLSRLVGRADPPTSESTVERLEAAEADRDLDPLTGLLEYDPVDATLLDGFTKAALVVEVDSHLMTSHVVGVEAGELLIVEAAERVMQAAEAVNGRVRRMSGPHFLVAVPFADESDLQDFASRLALVNDRPASTDGGALTVGIATAPRDGTDVPTLVRAAMVAVAYARREHPGSAVFFEAEMAEEAWDRFTVGRALRTAIDRREISLVYQPQLDLATGAVVGVEVLARWTDTDHGPISPMRFVRVADQLGLARALDRLVFEMAIEQLAAWDEEGIHLPRMSINVSPDTLRAGRVPQAVAETMRRHGIEPRRITVELIESRLLDADAGLDALRTLRDLGFRVSLDDFGTGYASFGQLVTLPIDELKIDRSFLSDSDDPVTSGAVVAAIVRVGQTLGLNVVAEGIERVDQQELLRTLRCPVGQGYLYSHPLTADELVEWLMQTGGALSLPDRDKTADAAAS